MTLFPVASPILCACCRSPKNAMFLHGPCNASGELQAAKYQITCEACGTSGPLCETPDKALKGWRLIGSPAIQPEADPIPEQAGHSDEGAE